MKEGLDFILSHFSEPLFPRKVSTGATNNKQYPLQDKETVLYWYRAALWSDCRINAFNVEQQNPNLIFIDLDASSFGSMKAVKTGLTKTLKKVQKTVGGHPTVYWSGRGYHIIQPIYCPEPLENIPKLKELDREPSNRFLQWAERYLSMRKCDQGNHPALKSCLLRVPGSKNSKCQEMKIDPEVKVIQRWNGHRPHYKLLLGRFYADLVGEVRQSQNNHIYSNSTRPIPIWNGQIPSQFAYIERLLVQEQRPIDDYRKLVVNLILSRYLINVKGLDYDQSYQIIWQWLDKCDELKRRLEPSRSYFERYIVRRQLEEAIESKRLPMTESTLQEKYSDLYLELMKKGSGGGIV